MTVYIFGGSNTAMRLGWADSLSVRLLRRVPVQNLGLGATNSLNALVRLKSDVTLAADDVVVWTNAINDAMCLSGNQYKTQIFLEYVEEMIVHCRAVGARFIPVLIDSFIQHLMVQQADYATNLLGLMDHYGLDVVHLPQKFTEETGMPRIPRHHFSDALHMVPQGELSEFLAELTTDLIEEGRGYPADRPCLYVRPGTSFEVLRDFQERERSTVFSNHMLRATSWKPPVSLCPDVLESGHTEIEAVTMLADPSWGRFTLCVGDQQVPICASHIFPDNGAVIALTAYIRLLAPNGVTVKQGEVIRFEWSTGRDPIPVELYFQPGPAKPAQRESRAKILSVLLRHQDI